ncbi:Cytosine/purine/uracil/thiamine/allantoin permease family protein [Hyalangium minutum]|uniref:Cytosine/purine/uracil/thiamine/allantoin permease family protein n=1 Tax=Hyalangium minutum TaxID=394096 RepID=A0A085W4W8_9BACT|nr:Cytosine/purine/uracil/thiamine/allantoin permease family protein [Hyalangium minutum]
MLASPTFSGECAIHDPALTQEALAELPPDIAQSPLFNGDLAPIPKARRNWTTYNFAALWISMAHCIPTYMLAGGLIAVGMNWWQALLTIGLGNLIVLLPILLNAHPGTKYGIPFPVFARASFGTTGANIAALLRAIVACGWFGIQTFIGGEAAKTLIEALWPSFGTIAQGTTLFGLSVPSAITFLLCWALHILIIYKGMNAVRVFENWAAPLVLVMAGVLLVWAVMTAGGLGPMLEQPSRFATVGEFWKVFIPSLTGMIGFWATLSLNIPDFTRYGRGQKEQMLGQTLGLPTTMIAFSAMGVIITSATQAILHGVDVGKLWDPMFLLGQLTSSSNAIGRDAPLIASAGTRAVVALISLFGVGVATVSVNIAANVVSPANDFANLSPRHISFKTGALITGILGIVMMPWKLLSSAETYIFNWLIGYSALLGPIAGIMIADYWLLRRKELDVADLYRPNGRYAGTNWVAVVALVVGVLPNLPGFLKSVKLIEGPPGFFDEIYVYAWFTGFILAGAVYLAGMRLAPKAQPQPPPNAAVS